MLRVIGALVVGGALFAATVGAAASLGPVDSSSLGAGDALVTSCDTDGVAVKYFVRYGTTGYEVATVEVAGIATPACDGKIVEVTLTKNSVALGSGVGPVQSGSGKAIIPISPPANAVQVNDVHVLIHDPT